MTRFVLVVVAAAGVAAGAVWLGVRVTASDAADTPPATGRAADPSTTSTAATTSSTPRRPAQLPVIAPAATDRLTASLAADLADRDPVVRAAAVAELAASPDADDVATLTAASRDPDMRVSGAAVGGLNQLYARGDIAARPLIDVVTDRSMHERVRGQALNGLAVTPTAETAALLLELLARGDDIERRSAAILLARQDLEVAVPALIDSLADRDEGVRTNAHEALVSRSRGRDFGMDAGAWRAWWGSRARP